MGWTDRWIEGWQGVLAALGGTDPGRGSDSWQDYTITLMGLVTTEMGGTATTGGYWNDRVKAELGLMLTEVGGTDDGSGSYWNDRVVSLLEQIVTEQGGTLPDRSHWNDHVLDLLDAMADSVGADPVLTLTTIGAPTQDATGASGFSGANHFEGDVFGTPSAPVSIAIRMTVGPTPSSNEYLVARKSGTPGIDILYNTGEDFQVMGWDSAGVLRYSKQISMSPTTEGDEVWVFLALQAPSPVGEGRIGWEEPGGAVVQDTTALYTSAPDPSPTHTVGSDTAGTSPFGGTLYEMRIFHSVLSNADMAAISSDVSPPTPDLVHEFWV